MGVRYTDTFIYDYFPPQENEPECLTSLPELHYPRVLNCVGTLIDNVHTAGFGNMPALYTENDCWTYGQLLDNVNRIANVLTRNLHLVSGNRVLLYSANTPMMSAICLAVIKAGGIVVPASPELTAGDLNSIIEKAKINIVLCSFSLKNEIVASQKNRKYRLKNILYFDTEKENTLDYMMRDSSSLFNTVHIRADEPCLILFTSGDADALIGVIHTHREILAITDCFPRSVLGTSRTDIFIGTHSLSSGYGLGTMLFFPLRVKASTILLKRLSPQSVLKAAEHFNASILSSTPSFYRKMLPFIAHYALPYLNRYVCAEEPLPDVIYNEWRKKTGYNIISGISSEELFHMVISSRGSHIKSGSAGKVIPGYQARIVDKNGDYLPSGKTGRLAIKGPTGCFYLNDERQCRYVHKGWNITGDAGFLDADGYFWYKGKFEERITSRGLTIWPFEVENILRLHSAVWDCEVVGLPDGNCGRLVKAYIVLRPGHDKSHKRAEDILHFIRSHLSALRCPERIEFVDKIED